MHAVISPMQLLVTPLTSIRIIMILKINKQFKLNTEIGFNVLYLIKFKCNLQWHAIAFNGSQRLLYYCLIFNGLPYTALEQQVVRE